MWPSCAHVAASGWGHSAPPRSCSGGAPGSVGAAWALAATREARGALQNYKSIGEEDEEPDETSSSESNMDDEPGAKKAKRARLGSEDE